MSYSERIMPEGSNIAEEVEASPDPRLTQLIAERTAMARELKTPEQIGEAWAKETYQRELKYAELEKLATLDPLTQLPNRRGFFMAFHQKLLELRRLRREPDIETHTGCLVQLDLDHFKNANDLKGHNFGDELLKKTARTIEEVMRPGDLLARFGGEEIWIFLPNITTEQAILAINRLRETLPLRTEADLKYRQTASFGILPLPDNLDDLQLYSEEFAASLFQENYHFVDEALYSAKHSGRNAIAVSNGGDKEGIKIANVLRSVEDPAAKVIHYTTPAQRPA